MYWLLLVPIGLVLLYLGLVILTDGRYFGKRLMYRLYDTFGPEIFDIAGESDRWQRLGATLNLRGDERILDVGTAIGDLPISLAARPGFRGQAVGVDWAARMVAAAAERARRHHVADRVRFQVADVRDGLPFAAGEFDVVFCLGLLETLPHAEEVLADLRRVLKPGGVLVVSLYRGWAALTAALSYAWYEEHLSALGFRDLRTAPCRRGQDVIIARL